MNLSDAGLARLKGFEGFRAEVYLDAGGIPTIAYGHKMDSDEAYPEGVSEADGCVLLGFDVHCAERAVMRLVTVALTQGQFDALVDFTYNLGAGRLASSTLLRKLNAGDYDGAADQLALWDHGMVDGKLVELPGLKARRQAEYAMWYAPA